VNLASTLVTDFIKTKYAGIVKSQFIPEHILLVGPSRSGKDSLALTLLYSTNLRYNGTSSLAMAPVVKDIWNLFCNDGLSLEEFYRKRHENRMFWFDTCNLIRDINPYTIPSVTLVDSDLLVGIRSLKELQLAGQYAKLVLYVDAPVPVDPTLEFSFKDVLDLGVPTYRLWNDLKTGLFIRNALDILESYNLAVHFPKKPQQLKLERHGLPIA